MRSPSAAIPVVSGALFLAAFGYLWYGVLFNDLQMKAHGFTPADYAGNSPLWYAAGGLIALAIAAGLAMVVRLAGARDAVAGLRAGMLAALGFGLPLVSYPYVYSPRHELGLFLAGAAHILIGWTLAASLIARMAAPTPAEP